MSLIRTRLGLALLGAMALAVAATQADVQRVGADTTAPVVEQSIVATLRAGELTLTGTDFGEVAAGSAVLFDYGPRSATVTSDSPLVEHWQSDRIEISVPWEVVSGELRVVVNGTPSEAVDLFVFEYEGFAIPPTAGTDQHELAVAVGDDGTVWINQEFHLKLSSITPGTPTIVTSVEIPQAPGEGIFALALGGVDRRSRISSLGEDITVDSANGIWFTQGGADYYSGSYFNTSRIVRYDPASATFDCYNLPLDNSRVSGVLVDEQRSMVWYAESSLSTGAAITGFDPASVSSDCLFDPYLSEERAPICEDLSTGACHVRFTLPISHSYPAHLALDSEGNIWFTEFWRHQIGRLTPETGELIEIPLPWPTLREGPGTILGAGPWELAFDDAGYLWVSEYFDASVLRLDPSLLLSRDCLTLDTQAKNPCIDEVFVGSNGTDGKLLHTVVVGSDGMVWFGIEQDLDGVRGSDRVQIGFIAIDHGSEVVLFPEIEGVTSVAGMAQDPLSGDIWFAQYWQNKVGRLHLLTAGQEGESVDCSQSDFEPCAALDTDGDGCTDAEELGPDEQLGGRRDPENFWDFYDTPNRDNERDGRIGMPAVLSVVVRIGADDSDGNAEINRYSDPNMPVPADIIAYHPAFDRSPSQGGDPWDLGPPDGYIGLLDVLGVILQYGHSCSGSN